LPRHGAPEHRRLEPDQPIGARQEAARRQRAKDGPSVVPGSRRRRAGSARHPGAVSFGYFSLGKQRKVTRPQGETRIQKIAANGGFLFLYRMVGRDKASAFPALDGRKRRKR